MPYHSEFNSTENILRLCASGEISGDELMDLYRAVGELFARLRPRGVICDFSAVTAFNVTIQTLIELAASPPAVSDPKTPRVIVAPAANLFGFARMFELRGARPNTHVVKTSKEAHAILGVQELAYQPTPQ